MTTDTIQQRVPPASISTTIDGGLGYDDLNDLDAGTFAFAPQPFAHPG
jgi:hypothetical protein